MWRKKEASTDIIIIIDVSNHTPKQKQILIGEPEEEAQFPFVFKAAVVLGAIGIFTYFCYHYLTIH